MANIPAPMAIRNDLAELTGAHGPSPSLLIVIGAMIGVSLAVITLLAGLAS